MLVEASGPCHPIKRLAEIRSGKVLRRDHLRMIDEQHSAGQGARSITLLIQFYWCNYALSVDNAEYRIKLVPTYLTVRPAI